MGCPSPARSPAPRGSGANGQAPARVRAAHSPPVPATVPFREAPMHKLLILAALLALCIGGLIAGFQHLPA
jgi:hypothetical protein